MALKRLLYEYKDYGESKSCSVCNKVLPIDDFSLKHDVKRLKGYRKSSCKSCNRGSQKSRYERHKEVSPFLYKATRIKSRSSSLGLPYNLDKEYLEGIWTGVCPVYGVEISIYGDRCDDFTAELDRLIPEKGYTKGNVMFISRRANRHKNNMTLEEVKKLYNWLRKEHDKNSG